MIRLVTAERAALGAVVPGEDVEPELEEDWSRQRWWQGLVEQKVEQQWLSAASVRQKVVEELGPSGRMGGTTTCATNSRRCARTRG